MFNFPKFSSVIFAIRNVCVRGEEKEVIELEKMVAALGDIKNYLNVSFYQLILISVTLNQTQTFKYLRIL